MISHPTTLNAIEERAEGRFVFTAPLLIDFAASRELRLRFEVGRKIYNALLGEAMRRVRRYRHELRAYEKLRLACKEVAAAAIAENELTKDSPEAKHIRKKAYTPYAEVQSAARKQHGCSHFALAYYGTELSRHIPLWAPGHALGATVVQQLVKRAWKTAEKAMLDPRIRVRFVRFNEMTSVESMRAQDAIRVVDDRVVWSAGKGGGIISMRMRLDRKGRDIVEAHARASEIVQTRILRKRIRGEWRYFAQIVLAGVPAARPWLEAEKGDVGIDLGISTLAVDSDQHSALYDTSTITKEQHEALALKMRRLQRAIDRSRRATNPERFEADGRAKRRGTVRGRWNKSERYTDLQGQLREAQRVISEQRNLSTKTLVNLVASLGNRVFLEKMNYREWQRTYGYSTGFAPGAFDAALKNRVASLGGEIIYIPTMSARLSQACHECGQYEHRTFSKNPLKRTQQCSLCGSDHNGVQADLYQSFLARFVGAEGIVDGRQALAAWPGALTRLVAASSTISNVTKSALVRSRSARKRRAEQFVAAKTRSIPPQESVVGNLNGKRDGDVSHKASDLNHRAPRWGTPHARSLERGPVRVSVRKRSLSP